MEPTERELRLKYVLKNARNDKPDTIMERLIDTIGRGQGIIIPEVDKYYVFVYQAKTKRIRYDSNPFVLCTGIYKWGFQGYNFHWEAYRQYSWNEGVTNLYEVRENELNIVEKLPIANLKST